MPIPARRSFLAVAVALTVLTAMLLAPTAAAAHVNVSAQDATRGGYAAITFRVPNERASASTVKIEINLPQDTPIASVSTAPVPGWTIQVQRTALAKPVKTDDGELTEAITKVTWSAASPEAAVQPDQFQQFQILAGPLPDTDRVAFKVLQYYSNGEIARWIEAPVDGQPEPENPAPVLTLAAAADGTAAATPTATAAAAGADSSSGSGAATGLAIAALIAGLAGLALGAAALLRTRRPGPTSDDVAPVASADGPVDKAEGGPVDKAEGGPVDKAEDGPVDKAEDGPVDKPEDGPVDKAEDGPVDKAEDKVEDGTPTDESAGERSEANAAT
jgi:uncharacterized protein YcnI